MRIPRGGERLRGDDLAGGGPRRLTPKRIAFDGLSIVGLLLVLSVAHIAASDGFAYDAHAYWVAESYGKLANTPAENADAFLYSPPILLAFRAIASVLPWPAFLEVYELAIGAGIWVLGGPLTAFVVFTPQIASEITLANIHIFLALVAVFGRRWPALWAFALLTKVTPGGVGLLWFAVRGEWRKLLIVLGTTAAIALPTVVLFPDLWAGWIHVLTASPPSGTGIPLPIRLTLAGAITVIGAKRDWPWVLPIAAMLALPNLWDVHGLSMLMGALWFVWQPLARAVRGPRQAVTA